ncbi:uncharacterized protein BT62DRAFT_933240 [Guyanagaster necrorhizus]|uniref:Uncharacterized protein n=1 Tax=Guyanagaster necrorhizus TaxID=856835 RepID=A0A9P7VRJ1_9AGAR|nr:uncharacterized protein BT62DRAFT_933240 [Guyanagaster necrorhizus MCA 3950]KAG7445405.1 hypothetical protein BT62DRAFT_933240 [Guyanagaster necrorhizus MCA 3950]
MPLSVPDAVFIAVVIEVLLYGMYTCLFAGSSYLLIFKRKKSKVIVSMIILNVIMWSVSTAHAAVSFDEKFRGFLRENGAADPLVFENNAAPRVLAQLSLECINFLFGDGIILWRAWVLWKCDRRVLYMSVILLLVTLGIGCGMGYALSHPPEPFVHNASRNPTAVIWGAGAMISTLITNICATSLIAYRTWTHHRLIRSLTGESLAAQFCKQNGILAFLIESGMLYCCTWFAAIFTFIFSSSGIYIMLGMLAQLTAIYPTLIITLVCVRATLDVTIETFEKTHQFAAAAGPRRSLSSPMHTTSLRVEMETRTYMSGEDIRYFALNTSTLKDDKDHQSAVLPDSAAGIRTSGTSSTASSVNVSPRESYSGSSA